MLSRKPEEVLKRYKKLVATHGGVLLADKWVGIKADYEVGLPCGCLRIQKLESIPTHGLVKCEKTMFENYKKIIADAGGVLLATEWLGTPADYDVKLPCGCVRTQRIDNIPKLGLAKCKKAESARLLEQYKDIVAKHGGVLLADEWVSTTANYEVELPCGCIRTQKLQLIPSHGLAECTTAKCRVESARARVEARRPGVVKLIDTEYRGAEEKHWFEWLECGCKTLVQYLRVVLLTNPVSCSCGQGGGWSGLDRTREAWLYLLHSEDFEAWKVGVTGWYIKGDRIANHDRDGWALVQKWPIITGGIAESIEKSIIDEWRHVKGWPRATEENDLKHGGFKETVATAHISQEDVIDQIQLAIYAHIEQTADVWLRHKRAGTLEELEKGARARLEAA